MTYPILCIDIYVPIASNLIDTGSSETVDEIDLVSDKVIAFFEDVWFGS